MSRMRVFVVVSLVLLFGCSKKVREDLPASIALANSTPMLVAASPAPRVDDGRYAPADFEVDARRQRPVSPLLRTAEQPLSTFAVDVDTGSYSHVRRILQQGRLPEPALVRTEEFLNYFDHDFPQPPSPLQPFTLTTELGVSPWDPQRVLLLVGIQGYAIERSQLPPANLVFLIDSSGSMQSPDRLDLVRAGLNALIPNLRAQDRIAVVSYAGTAGVVLPRTPGNQHGRIRAALDGLVAEGSTNGAQGIALAYAIAREQFISGGINRVILATDGDFNVGTTSVDELKRMVERERASGIALSTLGVGDAHYNDELAEQLADIGNGHHVYLDDLAEARRVLVQEMCATLLTIAQDVKAQVEFDPNQVIDYRLVGYENRALAAQDFADDRVDAGEIGAGHRVTALYDVGLNPALTQAGAAFGVLRLRYKTPGATRSQLIEQTLMRSALHRPPSARLLFAAAVAGFAERLRGSKSVASIGFEQLAELARAASKQDPDGERAELIDLIELSGSLSAVQNRAGSE